MDYKFENVINKAKQACANSQQIIPDHFIDIDKMVPVGSGVERVINDIAMTRYACYLVPERKLGKDVISRSVATRNLIQ